MRNIFKKTKEAIKELKPRQKTEFLPDLTQKELDDLTKSLWKKFFSKVEHGSGEV